MKIFPCIRARPFIPRHVIFSEMPQRSLVVVFWTGWWFRFNLLMSTISGPKMKALALTIWKWEPFEKLPKTTQKQPDLGFRALAPQPFDPGP